jgi:hypothetical protein
VIGLPVARKPEQEEALMKESVSNRTQEELIRASEHLHYEIWMFLSMADCLSIDLAEKGPLPNAIVESFVIHFRVLCDFFYPQGPKPNDVLASHYFDDPIDWPKKRPELSPLFVESRRRAGKEVAHLTYDRQLVKPEEKYWKNSEIKNQMIDVLRAFFEVVPEDRLGDKCKGLRQQILHASSHPVQP